VSKQATPEDAVKAAAGEKKSLGEIKISLFLYRDFIISGFG